LGWLGGEKTFQSVGPGTAGKKNQAKSKLDKITRERQSNTSKKGGKRGGEPTVWKNRRNKGGVQWQIVAKTTPVGQKEMYKMNPYKKEKIPQTRRWKKKKKRRERRWFKKRKRGTYSARGG